MDGSFFRAQNERGIGNGKRTRAKRVSTFQPNQKVIILPHATNNAGRIGYFQFVGASGVACLTVAPKNAGDKHSVYFVARMDCIEAVAQ